MKARGGTEILMEGLSKYVTPPQDLRLILTGAKAEELPEGYKYILWQLQNADVPITACVKDEEFMKKISAVVFLSSWQYERHRLVHGIPLDKSHVIRSAIEPIEYKKREGKTKLIYTSTPWRGLDLLLDCFELLNRDDVELDVYSSTTIYGDDFYAKDYPEFQVMFDRARSMKNVNYMGYASNEDIRTALQSAHIFAYPNNFEETSCLSMIEAGAAGCQMVATHYGVLPETSNGWANLVPLKESRETMVKAFTDSLNYTIDNRDENILKKQSDFFNEFYSWEKRKHEWNRLIEEIYEL
jgi:glycosyltransferase involved in cell wall biosynthesis